MAEAINQLTSAAFWLTGIALVILSWLLEPLRPILMRLVSHSLDTLIVLNAGLLVFAVAIEGAPILGLPWIDICWAITLAAFYSSYLCSSSVTVRAVVAFAPPIMFAASVAALRRAGIENSLTGGLFVFPIIIDITVLIALPFLILDKEMWESRTRIDSHQVNSSSSKS